MKKNDVKTGRTKPPEVRAREQMEDRAFNRMLLWLAATVVAEVVMLLVNRFYVHARVEELGMVPTLRTVLGVAPVVGIILFVLFLVWGFRLRRNEAVVQEGMLQIVLAAVFLAVGLGSLVMRNYGAAGAPMVLGVIPALGVLMLVFYLYQKEFFISAIAGALGILGMWLFRVSASGATYYGYLVVALVLILLGLVLMLSLKKKDGVLTLGGREFNLLQPGASYPAYYLTAVISAVILLAPLVLGSAVVYYAIWVMAAWLFILAVYFTSKLM